MTSTITPAEDLAPGMPSRIVTVSATDITEGGQSLAGQTVTFALSDSLDVSTGGDVIAKTQATITLDANGNGAIRLPVYDEAVKTWCGKEWAVLVAGFGSHKAIRVPAGSGSIALSALPNVRPLRGRELQWAITGVTLSVTTGSTAGGSVSLNGGVLDFDLVFPPAGPIGAQLDRGRIPDGTNLEAFADLSTVGTWQVTAASAGLITGWPRGVEMIPSQIVVDATGSTAKVTIKRLDRPYDEWVGISLGGSRAWHSWQLQAHDEHAPLTAPVYAGVTAHAMHGALYNEGSAAMRDLRSLVRRGLEGESVHLLAVGDSKTQGNSAGDISVNSYPAQLAELIGARPGVIYARGNTSDSRWTSTNTGGALWIAPTTTAATVSITVPEEHVGYAVRVKSSTAGDFTVTTDGVPTTFTTEGDSVWREYTVTGLPDTSHTTSFDFSALGTGWRLGYYRPIYASPGLTISNAGLSSTHAAEWTSAAGGDESLFDLVTTGPAVDAVLIGHGTNQPTNTAGLNEMYDDFVIAVGTVLGIAPGAVPDDREVAAEALYGIADRLDLPLVDNRVLLGNNFFAAAQGLAADTVHETVQGYAVVAANLARTLVPGEVAGGAVPWATLTDVPQAVPHEVATTTEWVQADVDEQGQIARAVDAQGRTWLSLHPDSEGLDPVAAQPYDVILLAGQSNMKGSGYPMLGRDAWPGIDQYPAANKPDAGTIIPATEPLQHYGPVQSDQTGLGIPFARAYLDTHRGRRVLLVPAAYGGTGFSTTTGAHWDWTQPTAGTSLAQIAVAQTLDALTAAGPGARLAGILWHQGEADYSISGTYAAKLDGLFAWFRSELGDPDLPIVVGAMSPERSRAGGGDLIDAAHIQTPARVEQSAYVPTPPGLHNPGDTTHISTRGLDLLGAGFEEGLRRAVFNGDTGPVGVEGLSAHRSGDLVTVSWDPAWCRVTDYLVEWRAPAGVWASTGVTHPHSIATEATLTATGPVEVRVTTVNALGSSSPVATTA